MQKTIADISQYIGPLNMNGLQGRMLRLPPGAGKTKEILLIYDYHSSIERWQALACDLNRYGAVTMPDLPGLGGMASLYKIGRRPSLDSLADYLAAFVKLRYKRRRVTIVAIGFGFLAATRMLQSYPDLAKKVDLLVGLGGFTHHDDLAISPQVQLRYRLEAWWWGQRFPAWWIRHTYLSPTMLHRYYRRHNGKMLADRLWIFALQPSWPGVDVDLWQLNDVRSHAALVADMLRVDNCQTQIAVPLWHLPLPRANYLNGHLVEQHMRVTFQDYSEIQPKIAAYHQDSDGSNLVALLPTKLRRRLAKAAG